MTVAELVKLLQTKPQDLLVATERLIEYRLLEERDVSVIKACHPRPDGWVHTHRYDQPSTSYLLLGRS